jgi:hypothetical protein
MPNWQMVAVFEGPEVFEGPTQNLQMVAAHEVAQGFQQQFLNAQQFLKAQRKICRWWQLMKWHKAFNKKIEQKKECQTQNLPLVGFIDAKCFLIDNTYTTPQIQLCTKNPPR